MNFKYQALCLSLFSETTTCAVAGEVTTKAADKLVVSGYTQGQAAYRNNLPDSLVNSALFIKCARVRLAAEITKRTESELELDFASSRLVKDAWMGISPTEVFTLQAKV